MGTALNISQDLDLDLEQIIGQCIAILGIRGSGKSNTAGVIFEELLRNNYPMSIVDIEGEYFGLKESYEVLVVGTGEGVEIEIDADSAGEIAQVSMEQNVPVVLDLSGFLSEERTEVLKAYLSSLWNLAGRLRRPYIIGIEEAHEFIPQSVKTELKEMIARIALRGRKRGLGGIIVSQRSAKVEKDVLSQAGILFLHRVVHEVDMRVYGELLPWRKSEVKEIIGSLDTGDCIYLNGESILPIYVRERSTFHAGFTPSLEAVASPMLKQVSASIIEAIERARGGKRKKTQLQELEGKIERLEEELAKRDHAISGLEDVARTLGYIRFDVPGTADACESSVDGERPAIVTRSAASESRDAASQVPQPLGLISGNEEGLDSPVIDITGGVEDEREELPPAVLRHIDRLVSRVAKKDLLQRRLLAFLVGRAPGTYTVDQLAAWTDCAKGLIDDEPPRDFLDEGLITRERRTDGMHYRSCVKSFVQREFGIYQPDIGMDGLHAVTQHLQQRLSAVAAI
ncbi:MAG: ATP-binding protein [Candidatus Bipolaricaulia bacterium]